MRSRFPGAMMAVAFPHQFPAQLSMIYRQAMRSRRRPPTERACSCREEATGTASGTLFWHPLCSTTKRSSSARTPERFTGSGARVALCFHLDGHRSSGRRHVWGAAYRLNVISDTRRFAREQRA